MMVLDPISRKRFLVGWNIRRQFRNSPHSKGIPHIAASPLRIAKATQMERRPQRRSADAFHMERRFWCSPRNRRCRRGARYEYAAITDHRRLRIAKAAGVHSSLGTDADGPAKLRFMESSAAAALLAGIEPARIFNHLSNEDLLGWVDSLRRKSSKSGVSGADSKSTRPRKRKLPSIRT